ncbi:PKD domain-containing protein, partial [Reichenbachiella sp.]|uniref:PKD domain-containing protein n=1 Tax=Reichenbachiella sp. TaxID=2184521 RepID=UPI00329780A0
EDITAESAGTLSGISSVRDITAVNIAGEGIYAFVVAENAKLLRIEFGLTVDTNYTTTDLGNLGGLLSVARGVSYVNEGGNHKLLIGNSNGTVVLVDFGTDLTSNPSSSTISGLSGLSGLRGLKLYTEGNNYLAYAIGTGASFSEIELIDFGNALSNTPSQSTLSLTGVTGLTDFSLIRDCDQWYGLTAGFSSNEIYKIMLGSDPRTVDSQQTLTGITVPLGVELKWELGNWHGFVSSDAGNFYRIDFGADFTVTGSEVFNNLTNFSLLASNVGFDIIKVNGRQYGLATNFSTSAFNLLNFGETCNATPSLSTASEPQISYSQSGSQPVEFISHSSNGNPQRSIEFISVLGNLAPAISLTTTNECVTQSNTFTPIDGGGLTYAWDFDNNGSTDSTDPAPSYTFGSTGEHIVKLSVNDGTCTNIVSNTVSIFPIPPTPSFTIETLPVNCTGQDIVFTNTSNESNHSGATLTYSWNYNGEGNTTNRDGSYNFSSAGAKTITLTAAIPGCSTLSAPLNINLVAGPSVDFSYGNKCLGDVTQFTNLTIGDNITGQTWDFGDLNGTTDLSPTHEYEAAGNFNVSLTVDNLAGCSNSLIIPLTIDDRPKAAFNMGVGCEGQIVGFEDQSTVSSANIESYAWDFGGQGSSIEEDPLFIFETQGTYQVKLTVASTFGCADEVTKNLNVQLAPVAAFDIDLGCLNASTQFIDRTDTEVENPINIWYWDINGDIIPNTQNPVEIFDTPGDYTATLTVTPGNLCISSVSHDFTIHELPVADFTVDKTCDNEFTSFTDASTLSTTSIIAYSWQFGDEGTGNSNPTAFNFDKAGDHLISFTITDQIGCESSAFQTITINPSPVAAFTVNKDIGPAPLLIDFTNTSTGATSHFWKFNDAAQTTSIETNPDFTYSNLGDYTAELISTNDFGCSDTTSIPLTVAEPLLDLELIQVSQEESEGRTSLSLTVKNSGNVVINGFDIRIDLDNNSSIFESYEGTLLRNQTINYPLNFTFSTANNNIGYTCISVIDLEEGQSDINIVNNEGCIDFEQKIIVENSYPNPAESGASKVRLNMILPTESPVQIFLLDATGGILYENVYSDTSLGLNSFFLDVYSLEQGLYFIKVVYDNVQSTQRFVKL